MIMRKGLAFISGLIVLVCGVLASQSCKVSNCNGGDTMVSSFDGDESKRMKGNCMSCHGPNGGVSGCFTIAGSAFDTTSSAPAIGATVYMYTQPKGGGDLVAILQVDRSGNFYTTSIVNMGNGLYPAVAYPNGQYSYMPSPTYSGQCNSCHGVVNPVITVR